MQEENKKEKLKRGINTFTRQLQNCTDPATQAQLKDALAKFEAELQALECDSATQASPQAPLSAFDQRPLNALPQQPDAQTVYAAPTAALAVELDAAGYPALWLDPLDAQASVFLSAFTGTDIVLTHPELHGMAATLSPDRFNVVCANCWPRGRLRAIDTVPMATHLLTLGERHDVLPIQSSRHGKLAQQLYACFGRNDFANYKKLARKVVAA